MEKMQLVASVIGVPLDDSNFFAIDRVQRITALLPDNPSDAEVLLAEAQIDAQGSPVLEAMVRQINKAAEPVVPVYKIKRSLKGARVKVAGFDGRKFAFGPVWNEQIMAKRNYALRDATKVQAHGVYLGVDNAMTLPQDELVEAICQKLRK